MRLEEVTPGCRVRDLVRSGPAEVLAVHWHGGDTVRVRLEVDAEIRLLRDLCG